jgi:hypothetical protein
MNGNPKDTAPVGNAITGLMLCCVLSAPLWALIAFVVWLWRAR